MKPEVKSALEEFRHIHDSSLPPLCYFYLDQAARTVFIENTRVFVSRAYGCAQQAEVPINVLRGLSAVEDLLQERE